MSDVLNIECGDETADSDLQLVQVLICDSVQAIPEEAHPLEQRRGVGLIPRQAVEAFGHDNVDFAALCGLQKAQVIRALAVGAADAVIGEDLGDLPPLFVAVAAAETELVLNGGLFLLVGGIAGIDSSAKRGSGWHGSVLLFWALPYLGSIFFCGMAREQADK